MTGHTRLEQTLRRVRKKLSDLTQCLEDQISSSDRVDTIVPREERRQKWQELRAAGFDVPELERSTPVVLLIAWTILGAVIFLAFLLENWLALLLLSELGLLARWLTRPLAVHPPIGCKTVHEMVLHLTPFRRADYDMGLWTAEDIADKVRWIVAQATATPFESVKPESRLEELMDC